MITFVESADSIEAHQLQGFFVGWPDPPPPDALLRILHNSDRVVVALDGEAQRVVGFVTAITDHVLCAYIPLLEVLPEYQGHGTGTQLMERMMQQLGDLYMIDLLCDEELQPFYQRLEMQPASGMLKRNYHRQAG